MFVQATQAVSAPVLRTDAKIQFFPGDMYRSCNACAFVASTDFPTRDNNAMQYACVPLALHLFVLGPIKCDPQALAVLLTIKEWNAGKTACASKAHLALYHPCAGTLQLPGAPHIPVGGSREDLHFRTDLPLQLLKGDCKMSSTHVQLTRLDACDAAARALFDSALQLFLGACNGFVHVIDWTCLLRLKLLAAPAQGTGLLAAATTAYQARLEDCTDESKYLLCDACQDECGCDSTSNDLATCSTDPTLPCP